jgi:hypothetical protein
LENDGARSLTCGSRDLYAAGHVSWPRAGDVSGHLEALQQPHGRVHFAGEHTSVLRWDDGEGAALQDSRGSGGRRGGRRRLTDRGLPARQDVRPGSGFELSQVESEKAARGGGFREEAIHTVAERYGDIAHVFVTYEGRDPADAAEPTFRGVETM